ncbi:MAG: N-acetylglucosamine-6-phosphate deacetylase [Betaproteobacteria bacterium]|nr:N-acetylglucosamine-6-phosphate deacetylase [Betaproteobacteria bacterium]
MTTLAGNILTPQGFVHGSIEFSADGSQRGRISKISGQSREAMTIRDDSSPIILPGFIDLHVHGGGGHDIMEGGDSALRVATLHASHGTTSMLATTMTAPRSDLDVAFNGLARLCSSSHPDRPSGCARVLGVHLEGPFINPGKLGAQPDFARPMNTDELRQLHSVVPIRLITLAPEVNGNMDAIEALTAAGFKIQIGHSAGTYEDGVTALKKGAGGFTHLFNAMTGMHHRTPGMVGAALAHAEFAELIPDMLHVHPGAIRVALRSIPRLFCVTDSTAAAGMPDGEYRLGRHTVTKCMGGVRLTDGTLAGSTLTMDQALRNLVNELGLDLVDASRRVSTNAADYLGLNDRGRLVAGAFADVVVLDRDLKLTDVFVEGAAVAGGSGV